MELLSVEIDLLMRIEFADCCLTEKGDRVCRNLMKRIYNGDSSAMVDLGKLYFCGVEECGIEKNDDKSAFWNLMAANKGNVDGIFRYGRNFLNLKSNEGKYADIQAKAMEYMQYAADKGHLEAMRTMGIVYTYGFGGYPICIEKAYDYLYAAIRGGSEEAYENLEELKRKEASMKE